MKIAFVPDVLVRFNIPDGAIVRIVQYLRDGWYEVEHEGRRLVANENDLVLHREVNHE